MSEEREKLKEMFNNRELDNSDQGLADRMAAIDRYLAYLAKQEAAEKPVGRVQTRTVRRAE